MATQTLQAEPGAPTRIQSAVLRHAEHLALPLLRLGKPAAHLLHLRSKTGGSRVPAFYRRQQPRTTMQHSSRMQ